MSSSNILTFSIESFTSTSNNWAWSFQVECLKKLQSNRQFFGITKFVMIWNELVIKLFTEQTFFQFSCSNKNPNSNAKNLRVCWAMSIKCSIWSVTPYVKSLKLLLPRDFSNVNRKKKKHIKNVEKCTFLAETLSKNIFLLLMEEIQTG